MYISPINLVQGLIDILEVNEESIQECLTYYLGDMDGVKHLNVFKGMRKTLPLSAFPCIQFEPANSANEWSHTSAQTGEYTIQCTLTVSCPDDELGAEYISQLTRRIVQIYTYPGNMCFIIPNEYADNNKTPVYVQFGTINNVTYNATKDGTLRVAQWDWVGRVLETFDYDTLKLGPCKMEYKQNKFIE